MGGSDLLILAPWIVFIIGVTALAVLAINRNGGRRAGAAGAGGASTLALLASLDLDAATEITTVQAVNTYVLGAVLREFQELRVQREQERLIAELDGTDTRFGADFAAWRARLESAAEFPRFMRIFTENIDPDAEATRDQRFEFGLDCLIRGIAATVGDTKRRGPSGPRGGPGAPT